MMLSVETWHIVVGQNAGPITMAFMTVSARSGARGVANRDYSTLAIQYLAERKAA